MVRTRSDCENDYFFYAYVRLKFILLLLAKFSQRFFLKNNDFDYTSIPAIVLFKIIWIFCFKLAWFFNEIISLKICITEICFVEITATWWGPSKLNGGNASLFMFCWTYWGTTNFRKSVILGSSKDLLLEWTTICQKILILG